MERVSSPLKSFLMIKTYVKYASTNTDPGYVGSWCACCLFVLSCIGIGFFFFLTRCVEDAGMGWLRILIRRMSQFIF
jgi:hypothetical protein